jgi:hypothetical protein
VIKVSAGLIALAPAWAQGQTAVRAITSLSTGASDNARGVPGDQKHTSSLIGRTSAGLDLGYQGYTTTHLLRIAVGAVGYPGSDAGTTFTQEGELSSQFTFQRLTFELGVTGTHSELNDLSPLLDTNISSAPQPAPVVPAFSDRVSPDEDLVPLGVTSYWAGSGAEAVNVELSPLWSLYQSAGVDAFSTITGNYVSPAAWAASTDVGLQRDFPRDGIRLEGTAGYEHAPPIATIDGVVPEEDGQFGRAGLGWSHQLSANWRSDLSGGAFAAKVYETQPLTIGPAFRAGLNWKGRWLKTAFLIDHTPQPSVVMGGIFLTDRASVRATGRFGRDERFTFAGLIRYSRLSALGVPPPTLPPPPPSGLMDPTAPPVLPPGIPPDQQHNYANRWQAQVAVGYVPWPNRRLFELNLSYRLTDQTGAVLGRRRLKTFERNVVMLTITVGFPTHPELPPPEPP